MFKNNMKIVLRNLFKQKVLSLINILGLAVGLAIVVLIMLFVKNEFSYDRFHKNADNLYRVYTNFMKDDGTLDFRFPRVAPPIGPALKEYFPEIKYSVRLIDMQVIVKVSDNIYHETMSIVDEPFFQAFSFPLIMGNPDVVFSQSNAVVITENEARKYFGNSDPLGKTLTVIWGETPYDFVVTGVAASVPFNSSIKFKILIDTETAKSLKFFRHFDNWVNFSILNFILVDNKSSVDSLLSRLPSFTETNKSFFSDLKKNKMTPFFDLQEISKIHLDPEISGSPNLNTIYILSLIAFIVLVIASINFINLSISRASLRSLEVGLRKVVGAERKHLIYQFWSESTIITAISMLLGILLAGMLLPLFNQVANTQLNIMTIFQPVNIAILLLLTIFVGILSGSYPAIVMSAFQTVHILKGDLKMRGKNLITRILVVIQFAFSIFLIISTIVLERQINYILTRDPGFNKNGVVAIATYEENPALGNNTLKLFRQQTKQNPNVLAVSGISAYFGNAAFFPIEKNGQKILVYQNRVDYDFLKTLNIKMTRGRTFSQDFLSDTNALVINESLVKTLDIKDPIGKTVKEYGDGKMTVIGVVKNFNFEDYRKDIRPALLHIKPDWPISRILVRITPQNISATLAQLGNIWRGIQPYKPFTYSFLDETLEAMYSKEKKWKAILGYSSIIAVLISCMGIFGLTSIAVTRRTKEIGIRKVLGANVSQISALILKDFMWLVIIGNVIAWPAAYYVMKSVLNNYFYRIAIGPQYFIFAGILSLFIVLLTTIYLALKAALANPVNSIKYE